MKVFLILGIVAVIVGVFYMKKESIAPLVSETKQGGKKLQPGDVIGPKKSHIWQRDTQKTTVTESYNIDEERAKIKRDTEKEALARVEAERQKQEQLIKQREIDDYLADGKRFFENGKFELCIEKMKEVLKRDRENAEAIQYMAMAQEKLKEIENQFKNPEVGRSRWKKSYLV